jgi:hypothetical protein
MGHILPHSAELVKVLQGGDVQDYQSALKAVVKP